MKSYIETWVEKSLPTLAEEVGALLRQRRPKIYWWYQISWSIKTGRKFEPESPNFETSLPFNKLQIWGCQMFSVTQRSIFDLRSKIRRLAPLNPIKSWGFVAGVVTYCHCNCFYFFGDLKQQVQIILWNSLSNRETTIKQNDRKTKTIFHENFQTQF